MLDAKAELVNQMKPVLDQPVVSPLRKLDEDLAQIPGLIRLTLGEPDLSVSEHIKVAAQKAIAQNDSHYAPSSGSLNLRRAISQYMQERFASPAYDPQTEVVVTIGAAEALFASFNALFRPGDKLIIPTPAYPVYATLAQQAGLEIIELNTAPDFNLTPAKLKRVLAQHPDAKGMIMNYPANPTGVTYQEAEIQELVAILARTSLLVISDEIYAELSYDYPHTSMAKWLPNQTIVVSGLSKAFAMTGYRVGYLVGPQLLVQQVQAMHQLIVACPPGPMMAAAEEALTHGQTDLALTRQLYQRRGEWLLAGLAKIGFQVIWPAGTFYIFAKIPTAWGEDDVGFVTDLAHKAKVGLVPGSLFGAGGAGYVRLSYAAAESELALVLNRLTAYVN